VQTINDAELAIRVGMALDRDAPALEALHGGMVGEVYLARWTQDRAVIKVDRRERPQLAIEGMMLGYLARESELPVPALLHVADDLLIMQHLPGTSQFNVAAEQHAAKLLADLHAVTGPACGFESDTLIGLFPQPNGWTSSWVAFFGERRLYHLAQLAVDRGAMPLSMLKRVDALIQRLDQLIDEPAAPALVHGDIWTSNLLADDDCITGCLDPAIYYGHPEVELAYIALFHSFGEPFFQRYHELSPIAAGFFEERMDVYQLYPLLSHICHFGGHYVDSTAQKLTRLGF